MPTFPGLDVSRETLERLAIYQALVKKWTPRINLISRHTRDDIWDRHIVDSAQLAHFSPESVDHWVDLGSGAGFPGLVIAILAKETGSPRRLTLVESDSRKAVFLRTVLRETEADAHVVNKRIEDTPRLHADVVSARALAGLQALLDYSAQHLNDDGIALFPKGENWRKEVDEAQSKWRFDYEIGTSETNATSVILCIKGLVLV